MALDITSYEIGKKSGGGITPTGTINITENGTTNVTNYATANVNVQPDLESKELTITSNTTTTITPTAGKDGLSSVEVITNISGGDDWSDIGYSSTPQSIVDAHNYAKTVLNNFNANVDKFNTTEYQNNLVICPLVNTADRRESFTSFFYGCSLLIEVPAITVDLSKNFIKTLNQMFYSCSNLRHIDFSNFNIQRVSNLSGTFAGCPKLDNDTLNQILHLCTTVGSYYTGTKTLAYIGINSSYDNFANIPNLSNYQEFLNAGWTIS